MPLSLLTSHHPSSASSLYQRTLVPRCPLIYSCWHRRWRRSAVLHLSMPDVCRRWRPGILEFNISLPITGTISTRFTSCTGIIGLCGTCFQCLWWSHCREEESSVQETRANRTFFKMNNKFYDWLIWLSNIIYSTLFTISGRKKRKSTCTHTYIHTHTHTLNILSKGENDAFCFLA